MNWELQLAAAMTVEDDRLIAGAKRARELARLHRHGAALKVLWDLLVTVPRRNRGRSRAFLLIHMGHVYRRWIIDVAFRFFRDARDLSREAGFLPGEMVAECSLGQLYLDWKEHERALVRFERCLRLSRTCAGLWWQRNVLAEVVACLHALGRTERTRALLERLARMDVELQEDLWGRPEGRSPGLAVTR
jgi:hypothetical protein